MNFANITVSGFVTKDPVVTSTKSGSQCAMMSVAVNTGWGDHKVATFYIVSVFGKQSEFVGNFIKKGSRVIVSGEPWMNEYTKDGVTHKSIRITANTVVNCTPKEDSSKNESQSDAF